MKREAAEVRKKRDGIPAYGSILKPFSIISVRLRR